MEVSIDVKSDIAQALRKFNALLPAEFPFVVALALNRTAIRIREDEKQRIKQVFDRPVPFTQNAVAARMATKQNLQAELFVKDFAGKGVPASKYLAAEIYGGERRLKRFERALSIKGLLPAGMAAVPAKGFPLDAYGNISGAYITRMLSDLQAFGEVGYLANRNKEKKSKGRFYVVNGQNARDNRGLPWGIYERGGAYGKTAAASALGINSRMVIAFVKAPRYTARFDFFKVADDTARRYLAEELHKAADTAISTGQHLNINSFDGLFDALEYI